ncbi:hypothetical protein ACIHEJ_38645 [Streptomyces sp. NPDC052301]|uniref:hypothetical protein n=1 Tax=Streptomyces sp. NPDC052301 TaxID=3365687 RepID=UPI0037D1288F
MTPGRRNDPDRVASPRRPEKGVLRTAIDGHIHQPPCSEPLFMRTVLDRDGSRDGEDESGSAPAAPDKMIN